MLPDMHDAAAWPSIGHLCSRMHTGEKPCPRWWHAEADSLIRLTQVKIVVALCMIFSAGVLKCHQRLWQILLNELEVRQTSC